MDLHTGQAEIPPVTSGITDLYTGQASFVCECMCKRVCCDMMWLLKLSVYGYAICNKCIYAAACDCGDTQITGSTPVIIDGRQTNTAVPDT